MVCAWPLAPGIRAWSTRSPPLLIGSASENAVRNGFFHCSSWTQAARFAADAGSSGAVGTSVGNWRAPALYESSGNGASYAAITSGARSEVVPMFTIWPTAKSGTSCENRCQLRKASPGGLSPVGRNVLAATTRANRSGSSAASRRPMSPPQSWQTRVMWRRSSVLDHRVDPVDVPLVRVVLARGRLVGAAEADEVGRDRPEPGRGDHRDHRPVEVAPRRLAVQQQHRLGRVARALVDDVDAQRLRAAVTAGTST